MNTRTLPAIRARHGRYQRRRRVRRHVAFIIILLALVSFVGGYLALALARVR